MNDNQNTDLNRNKFSPFEDTLTGEDVIANETAMILEMWSFLKDSLDNISNQAPSVLKEKSLSYEDVKFIGFNEEKEKSYLNITKEFIKIGG